MTDDPAWALAQHVCRTGYADLPASTIRSARRDILDTFGCMLGGSGSPGIDELFAVIGALGRAGGKPRAAARDPPAGAAGRTAERQHGPRAGLRRHAGHRRLDPSRRLGARRGAGRRRSASAASAGGICCWRWRWGWTYRAASPWPARSDRGWHRTAAIGVFGAAAAAGKLIGLTAEQMLNAFGIAYSHAAGNRQCILDGALTKRLQAGQAASAGVFSAVLAQTGFTGARNIFNGRFGFLELYQPNGHDASLLLRDLGTVFRGEALSYKPYPCGRPLHAAIDAALAARAALAIAGADDIEAVTIEADPAGHADQFERRARQAPPDPGGGGAVCPALPGRHRPGARQGRDRRGGRSGRCLRCWRCRTGSPGWRARAGRDGR